VDELVPYQERMPWQSLREQIQRTGQRNATLMALDACRNFCTDFSNATNGIEPPRSYVSIKGSKHGQLKQVVPEYKRLKNRYELLWDQISPEGLSQAMCGATKVY
jgi:ribonucleoside-diphosphate reductase alpha chain